MHTKKRKASDIYLIDYYILKLTFIMYVLNLFRHNKKHLSTKET